MANIDSIKEKLAALLEKTVANGASESEATAALEFAQRLAAKYEVSLDDLKADETALNIGQRSAVTPSSTMHEVDRMLAVPIARYTDTRTWIEDVNGGKMETTFFGADSDVELALFTRELLRVSMTYEYKLYKEFVCEGRVTHGTRYSFMAGFAERIRERLAEYTRYKADTVTGTELITLKGNLVTVAFDKLGLNLYATARHKGSGKVDMSAVSAGRASGDRANLGAAATHQSAGLLT